MTSAKQFTRREWFHNSVLATGASAAFAQPPERTSGPTDLAQELSPIPTTSPGAGLLPRRPLGKTGETVSILGMGGHHLGDSESVDDAVKMVHEALDKGLNFFDNCWEYHNGKSEAWLGQALSGHRDKAFIMTKVCTHGRGAKLGMQMLEESLRRLQTDHLDLWQTHAISFDNVRIQDKIKSEETKSRVIEACAEVILTRDSERFIERFGSDGWNPARTRRIVTE